MYQYFPNLIHHSILHHLRDLDLSLNTCPSRKHRSKVTALHTPHFPIVDFYPYLYVFPSRIQVLIYINFGGFITFQLMCTQLMRLEIMLNSQQSRHCKRITFQFLELLSARPEILWNCQWFQHWKRSHFNLYVLN